MVGNHVLRLHSCIAVKLNFQPYIQQYTSLNENFENSYPLFNSYPDAYIQIHSINRGSYMSADVFLNLLKELGKNDKMQGIPRILLLLCNKVNHTGACMLDSIYHMALNYL